ncbi:sensor histidine kinase [Chryseolinea sp. T2]|uniref:sensor histidine kinase n=1 Tax=Chryseolinea sp. T2 TaxID=3129255 RepID=UPI003078425A
MRNKFSVIVSVLCIPCLVYGQSVFEFSDSTHAMSPASSIEYLVDPASTLELTDIVSKDAGFRPLPEGRANFGKTQASIWIRLVVRNTTGKACYLQLQRPTIHYVDIYHPENGGYQKLSTGALRPWTSREIKSHLFYSRILGPHEEGTMYIKFKSDLNLDVPFTLGSMESCLDIERKHNLQLTLLGALAALMIFNVFIWMLVREKAYLYYSLCLFFKLVSLDMLFTGIGFQFLWPGVPQLNLALSSWIAMSFVFTISFGMELLNTRAQFPAWHKLLVWFIGFAGIIIIVNVAGYFYLADILDHIFAISSTLLLFVLGFVALRSDVRVALYFIVALACLVLTIVLHALYVEDVLPANTLSYHVALGGNLAEALLFAFALAHKIRTLRSEREKAQRETLELVRHHAETLTMQVQQRTEEIAAQNEELIAQQEQINFQNELLTEAKTGLEREVASRMEELLSANRELVGQNHQLEQFAFIIAHNLRAPVARIQGLGNILAFSKNADESVLINQKIKDSADELNAVLTDLSRILDITKGTNSSFETIDILESLGKVKLMLQEELQTSATELVVKTSGETKVYSLAAYLESILYNLISNAIKYRSPKRTPLIQVTIYSDGPRLRIRVEDNGMGIDMTRFGKKLFGLYQRFHLHLDGKGMGLHLVKLQTEALGGKISVESVEGIGTAFEIDIPKGETRAD